MYTELNTLKIFLIFCDWDDDLLVQNKNKFQRIIKKITWVDHVSPRTKYPPGPLHSIMFLREFFSPLFSTVWSQISTKFNATDAFKNGVPILHEVRLEKMKIA